MIKTRSCDDYREYIKAREFYQWSLIGDGGEGDLMWLMGAADSWTEMQILEERMIEGMEGLA